MVSISMVNQEAYLLNGICPYFTMFPLNFPLSILKKYASRGEWILDPFCGRGTTNYAARCLGMPSIGIDSSPVAVALSKAKLANTSVDKIVEVAKSILCEIERPSEVPTGEFWERVYHKKVLRVICRFRDGLKRNCSTDTRIALRAIIMGALHGPVGKVSQSYFSNQCPRTYAPKPGYAIRFWKKNKMVPKEIDVISIIRSRAFRYYQNERKASGQIILGDSCNPSIYDQMRQTFGYVITSPPYFGMNTYLPDQWLRLWFLGGKPEVDYSANNQISHTRLDAYIFDLESVWQQVARRCHPGSHLVVRVGSINSKKVNTKDIIKQSLKNTDWRLVTIKSADTASKGKRQALYFLSDPKNASQEFDFWARLN